jgi:stage V sporulation protein B
VVTHPHVFSRLTNIAIPLAFADNLKVGISTAENLMVPKRLSLYPGEVSALGTFGTVVGMVFPVLMFPCAILYALAELLIPEFAKCSASNRFIRIRYLARRSLKVSALYGFMCGGILYLIAVPLCKSIYGNIEAGKYLQVYSILVPMLYTDAITDAMIKGLGQQKTCVKYNIISSALDVCLLFVLLPVWGMRGYYISFIITHMINFLLSISRLLKISKITIPPWIFFHTCTAWLLSLCSSLYVHNIAIKIIVYLLLFNALLVLLGVVSKHDILWIRNIIINKKETTEQQTAPWPNKFS